MSPSILSPIRKWFRKVFFHYAYSQKPPWDTGITPPELINFIEHHQAGKALDLGCGTGTNVVTLAKHGWHVTGVDYIPRAVRAAKRKIEDEGIAAEVHVDDVTQLSTITERYDLVYDIGCYHTLSPAGKRAYERNLSQLMKPGGSFLLYGFLSQPGQETAISEDDISRLSFSLTLVKREDGQDRERPSAWFEFQYIR